MNGNCSYSKDSCRNQGDFYPLHKPVGIRLTHGMSIRYITLTHGMSIHYITLTHGMSIRYITLTHGMSIHYIILTHGISIRYINPRDFYPLH